MVNPSLDIFTQITRIQINVEDLLVVQTALFGVDLPANIAADPSGAFTIKVAGLSVDMLSNKIEVIGSGGKAVAITNPAKVVMFVNLDAWTQGLRFKSNTLLDADGYYIQTLFINVGRIGEPVSFPITLRADLTSTAYNLDFWTFAKQVISNPKQINFNFALTAKNLAGSWTSFATTHLAANNGSFHAPATKTLKVSKGLGLTLT